MNALSNKTSNKKFGYFFTIIFFLMSIYFFSFNDSNLFYLMLIMSLFFLIISYLRDHWLKELNNSWFRLGLFLSKIISPIIIGIIFYFLITPFGIIKWIISGRNKKNNKTNWRSYSKIKSEFKNPF
tara:strand:+ start:402 stop:779 length:378 start_codon:yes stop_codon:yes gene_type:complete